MTLNISRCRERCGWHLQLGSTTLFRLWFRISTSAKIARLRGVIPSGVIVGNSGVFPNVLILKNPRQLATYSIGFVETRHLRYSWWREASIELFRGCTRLEPFAKRLRIPFKISVRHSSLESRAAHTTRAPLIAS